MVGGDDVVKKDAERYIFFSDTTVRSPAATIILLIIIYRKIYLLFFAKYPCAARRVWPVLDTRWFFDGPEEPITAMIDDGFPPILLYRYRWKSLLRQCRYIERDSLP